MTRAAQHLVVALLVAACSTIAASALTLEPAFPACIQYNGNAPVLVTSVEGGGWSAVRVYFRATGTTDFYYLEMRAGGDGMFWAVLPKPERRTEEVDLQLVLTNLSGEKTKTEITTVAVRRGCDVALTAMQRSSAENLVVGETLPGQHGNKIVGFECDGIISRIDASGRLSPDEVCRKHAPIVPLALLAGLAGGVIIDTDDKEEASPCRPCEP